MRGLYCNYLLIKWNTNHQYLCYQSKFVDDRNICILPLLMCFATFLSTYENVFDLIKKMALTPDQAREPQRVNCFHENGHFHLKQCFLQDIELRVNNPIGAELHVSIITKRDDT